jgi:hypothetical protein
MSGRTRPLGERNASPRRRRVAHRDQDRTPFAAILEQLVTGCTGALGAALVDAEGEAVDYAGVLDAFDVKVAAAHLRILLHEAAQSPAFGERTREIIARAATRTLFIRALADGYALVLVLGRGAFAPSRRAVVGAERALAREAGWDAPPDRDAKWYPVEVETSPRDRRRPSRMRAGAEWQAIEVMGSLVGLRGRERGFRVRLRSGAEMTLVREPFGRWYADEPVGDASRQPSS